jgi:cytochrome P450
MARNPFWMKDEEWKEKRYEVMPAMSPAKLKAVYPLIVDGSKGLGDYIDREIKKDNEKVFDSRDICARYTCDTISSCTFGTDAQSFTSDNPFFLIKGRQLIRGIAESLQTFLPVKMLPGEIEEFFIEIAKEAIRCRTESKIKQDDFLTYTIALKEKKNMSDIDAAAHCVSLSFCSSIYRKDKIRFDLKVTLFLDGYETTSVTLHQAFYELGKDKRAQTKLRNEILENVDENGNLSYDKLLELPYLNQVFYEVLRMHPPLLLTTRVASEDVEVKGFNDEKIIIKKDVAIWVPIHSIQRDAEFFPNPDLFNPERFDEEHGGVKAFKDRCVLVPFGDGPRICSGMRFAYVQVKAAMAEVVKRFEISVNNQTPENLKISPTEFMNVMTSKLWLNFKPID